MSVGPMNDGSISIQAHCGAHIAANASCGVSDPGSGQPRLTISSGCLDIAIIFRDEWQMSAVSFAIRDALRKGRQAQVSGL